MTPSNATGRILITIGHTNHSLGDFLAGLVNHSIESLSDVRIRRGGARLGRFLNSHFRYKGMTCPHHFIRLGPARPFHDLSWLMPDTLFPLPKPDWLQEF